MYHSKQISYGTNYIFADRTAAQYDRLLAFVRLSVHLSIFNAVHCDSILRVGVGLYRAQSCTSVFPAAMFQFVHFCTM